ncbi:alpha/beta fold hydrolase [Actinomadura sp. 21ATH]|uniref:alpha/beta fold hydrolase n=1 Tax=Actinomadura sp. 21ATH TaxID=1735444 RepID=UPI0035BEEABA
MDIAHPEAPDRIEVTYRNLPHARMRARAVGRRVPGVPEIVLVQGMAVSDYLVPALARLGGWTRAHLVDLPGLAGSGDPPHELDIAQYGRSVAAWLDAAGLGRVVVAGHSSGTQIAAHAAALRPDGTVALVLASPTVDPVARSIPRLLLRWRLDARREPDELGRSHRPEWVRAGPRRLLHIVRAHLADRLEDVVRDVPVPVLVLRGREDRLPRAVGEKAYAVSGWSEAVAAGKAGDIRSDALAEWIAGHYPRRRYPVVFLGSANGALVHLAAALGAPWLPQTVLVPVRRHGGHPDEPREGLRLSRAAGEALLAANPDLVLHHMHDVLGLGRPTVRLCYPEPDDLSPAVAGLFRDWYRRRGIPADRLFASCFVLLEPWWTLRTGSVPYWTSFNTEPARRRLLDHLDGTEPFDEIRLTLMSNGVAAPGQAGIPAWREVLARARTAGEFTGVDPRAYPRDFASFARMHRELARVRPVQPMPGPMDPDFAAEFLARRADVQLLSAGRPPG